MSFFLRAEFPEGYGSWDIYDLLNKKTSNVYRNAFLGFFDMPARDGTTFHDWGTHYEPIFHNLKYKLKKVSFSYFSVDLDATKTAFDSDAGNFFNSSFDIEIFEQGVGKNILYKGPYKLVSGPVFTKIKNETFGIVQFTIEIEDTYSSDGLISNPSSSDYRIGNYPLYQNFGIKISDFKDLGSYGGRISFNDFKYPNTAGEKFSELHLSGVVSASSFYDLNNKLNRLKFLFRDQQTFYLPDSSSFDFFVDNGFKISKLASDYEDKVLACIDFKLNEIK
jgi:hypothetical protein